MAWETGPDSAYNSQMKYTTLPVGEGGIVDCTCLLLLLLLFFFPAFFTGKPNVPQSFYDHPSLFFVFWVFFFCPPKMSALSRSRGKRSNETFIGRIFVCSRRKETTTTVYLFFFCQRGRKNFIQFPLRERIKK